MYKILTRPTEKEIGVVGKQVGDVLYSIPFDPMNSDYQEFLRWVAEGGVPLPPDSQE